MLQKLLPLAFALVMLAGGGWLIVTGNVFNTSPLVFDAGQKLSRVNAQALYRDSLDALAKKDYATAVKGFNTLEKVYPALRSIVALHQAEAYEGLPDEMNAQFALKRAMDAEGGAQNKLYPQLLYELASSDFRAKELKQARERFTQLQQQYPNSPWGKAADYYVGLMGMQQAEGLTVKEGTEALLRYLQHSPDGRYASFAAHRLLQANASLTPEQQGWVGAGLANNPEYAAEAIQLLTPLPRQNTWFALGKALVASHQTVRGVSVLADGFKYATQKPQAEAALAMIVANSKPVKPTLQTLLKQSPGGQNPPMGDLVLWELADAGSSTDANLYRQILQHYPKGDYAAESSWRLLWAKRHDANAFIESASAHERLFPQARSYPKVVFWHAKMLEQQNQKTEAATLYSRLSKQFTAQYYGYRAKARLADLAQPGQDAGWSLTGPISYPQQGAPTGATPAVLQPLPEGVKTALNELAEIGAYEDAKLLITHWLPTEAEQEQAMPWLAWQGGQTGTALKAFRAQVEATQLAGKPVEPDLLQLAYPLKYTQAIGQYTQQSKVDPYLVTALIREESSFNPRAISPSAAYGLMQLLLPTASEQVDPQDKPLSTTQLFDPTLNIKAGTRYVAWLMNYQPLQQAPQNVVAAYNAGPGQVSGWLKTPTTDQDLWVETLPADETRDYIRRVFTSYWTYIQLYGNAR
jgi:soluble lytic murein transglycosylase